MASSFTAQLSDFAKATQQRIEAVVKDSAQEVVSRMQTPVGAGGNLPVDTGFLRASIVASNSEMASINPASRPPDNAGPGSVPYVSAPIALVIAQTQIGQTIFVGYTAGYAQYQENKRGFVRLAAMQWEKIVAESCDKLKASVTGAAR